MPLKPNRPFAGIMSRKTNNHPPPLQQQNLLYNQDGEYTDTYLESLSQDCTATQTTSDSEWKYDNCGCGMNIPWHMITYKMKQNEKPECPPCPEPAESPSMTRLKELTVGPIDQDQFIDLTQEVLNDQLATDDMTIPEIEKQVIQVAGLGTSKAMQETDSTAVYRPKPKAEQVYDPMDERHNEPYMDKMFTYFPDFFEDSAQCSSKIEMPWTNILLPKNCSIRKTYKPPKQQKKTPCVERKHAAPVKKGSKSKIRVKKISRIHILNSKEAIAITSTLSNLLLNPPSKSSPGSSFSQSFLMKPKNKPIEMTNSISHESNLMSIYNITTTKESKKKTKKSHASVPMVKSKGSKHSLSKGSISKNSVSKAAKIRSKTDRITSLLDSCKKEMEPIKEGINKLRARIRELNLPDFHETKPANPYCMSSSYGAMMGTELSFTYSQAMPMHCFPCPPYYHAPLYPPMPNMKSVTKRAKHRNQINRQTSVSETDSEATPFSDGEEESCSCLGHRAESKDDPKPKLPKEPKKCEDGWDFQIATRIGRTNCFELPTNNQKPTKNNMSRSQNNAQNEDFCKCSKIKSNYKSCGYTQDYEQSDNDFNRPVAKLMETNICCKCKEHIDPEPKITNMDWFCKCEQKNAPANFKVYDQLGCFCPPSTEGDSTRCNCLQENSTNCNSEKAEFKSHPDDICKSCNRKLNPNVNNNMNLSKMGFRNTCMDQITKYQAEKEETKCCSCLPYSESPRSYSKKIVDDNQICSSKNQMEQNKSQRYVNDFIEPEAYSQITQKSQDDANICNCLLSNKSQMEQNKSQKSVNDLPKCNCNKMHYESNVQQKVNKTGVSTIEIEDTISIDHCKCKKPMEESYSNGAKVCNCLKGTSQKALNESRVDMEGRCACSRNSNQRPVDNSAMQFVKSVNSQLNKIQSKCQEALEDNYGKTCECGLTHGNKQMDQQKSNRTLDKSRTNVEPTCNCSKYRNESRMDQNKSQRTMDESLMEMAKSVNSQMDKIQSKSQRSVGETRGANCKCGLNRNMSEIEQNKSQRTINESTNSRKTIEESNVNVAKTCKCGNKNRSEIDQRSQRTINESTVDFVSSQKINDESNLNVGKTCQCGINKNMNEIDQKSQRTINESTNSRKTIEESNANVAKACKCGNNKNRNEIDQRSQRTINESTVDFVSSQKIIDESNVNVGRTCQCGINKNRSEIDQKIIDESNVNIRKTCQCGINKNRSEIDQKSQRTINESTVDFVSSQKINAESNANVGKICKCGINKNRSEIDQKSQRTINESTVDFASSQKIIDESKVNVGKTCKCGINKNRSEIDQKSQRTINESAVDVNAGKICKCGLNKNRSELEQNKSQRTMNESAVSLQNSQKTMENAGRTCKCGINRNQSELAPSQSQKTIESTVDIVNSQLSKSQKNVESMSDLQKTCGCSKSRSPSRLDQKTIESRTEVDIHTCNCAKMRNPSRMNQSQRSVNESALNFAKSVNSQIQSKSQRTMDDTCNCTSNRNRSEIDRRTIDDSVNNFESTQFSVVDQPNIQECNCNKNRIDMELSCNCAKSTNQNVYSQNSQNYSQRTIDESDCKCSLTQNQSNVVQAVSQRTIDETRTTIDGSCDCTQRTFGQSTTSMNKKSSCKQSNINQSEATMNESRGDVCICFNNSHSPSRVNQNQSQKSMESAFTQMTVDTNICNCLVENNQSIMDVDDNCVCESNQSRAKVNQNISQRTVQSAVYADTSCDCSVERDLSRTAQYRNQKANESSVSFADSFVPTLDEEQSKSHRIMNEGDSCTCTCSPTRVQNKIKENMSQRTIDGSCNCSLKDNQSQIVQQKSQKSIQQYEISLKQKCDCASTRNENRRTIDDSTMAVKNRKKAAESSNDDERKCSCSSDKKYKSEADVAKKSASKLTREPSEVGEVKRRCRCCANMETGKKCTCSLSKKPEDSEPKPKKKCVCSSSKSPVRVEDTEKSKKKCNSCQTSEPHANKSKISNLPSTIIKDDMQCTCKKIIDPKDENKPKCACTDGMSKLTITSSKSVQKSASPSRNASNTKGSKKDLKTIESKVEEPDADEKSLTDREFSNELKSKSGSISKNVTSVTGQTTGSQAEAIPEESVQSETKVTSPKVPSQVASKTLEESQQTKSGSITSKEFSKQLNESLQKVKSGESSKQDVHKTSKQDVQGSKHSCKVRIPIKKSSCECNCSDDELQVYHSPKEFSKVPCKNRTRASHSRRSRSCLCETAGDDSSSSSCDYVAKVKPKSRARSCECNDIKPLKPKRLICQKSSADSKESNRPKSCECDSKDSQKSARARTHESSSSFEMKRKKEPECDCEELKRNFDDASDSTACGQEVVSRIDCPKIKKQEMQEQDSCECPSSQSGSSDKKVVNKPSRLPTLCARSSDESENNLQIQQSYIIKGDKVATRTVASWVRPCTKVIRKSFEDVSCSPCDAQKIGSKVDFKGITITSKVNLTGTTTPPAPSPSLANSIDEIQGCMANCSEPKSEPETSEVVTEDKEEPPQVAVEVDNMKMEKSQVSTNTSFVRKKKIYKESKETNTDLDICCCRKAVSSNFAKFKLKGEFDP